MAAGILLLTLSAAAQVTIGDNVSLTGNGTISAGYNGSYGNEVESNHGLGIGGTAAFNGFYYNPNFLSFNVDPYYNQSRTNSNFASVTDATGVSVSTGIFAGSHFPGSINYYKSYNTTGNYGIPGITSLNTDNNSQGFGVGWGAYVPGLPTLRVGYQSGSNNYSLYGTNENGSSHFDSFYLNSTYTIAGFGLGGGISHGNSNALIPQVLVNDLPAQSNSDTTSYNFSASHPLPWNGSWSSSFNRTNLASDYLGYTFNGNIDSFATSTGFHPTPKLTLSAATDYTDNLSGSLYQALVPGASGSSSGVLSGASGTTAASSSSSTSTTPLSNVGVDTTEQSSHAWDFIFNTNYAFATDLQAQGFFERRQQSYFGANYGSNLYSAGVYYTRQIVGGYLGSSVNLIDSTIDGSNQNQLGFTANANYNRRFGNWYAGGYFSYAQNVQTILITYTSSFYNFAGNVSRRLGRWYWTATAGGGRTGLTAEPGSSSSSESFTTSIGNNRIAASASYSKSDGNSLATGGGLNPIVLPPVIPSNLLVIYGGKSYSATISGSPMRRLQAAATYVKSTNNLNNVGLSSWNNYEEENVYLQYQFRQIGLNGGYSRLVQSFSASQTAPANFSSFYIGIYRWFNLF